MTLKEHLQKNISLAWPVMLGQLGHVAVGLADSIMIGKIGVTPLASAAFANSIFVIPMVFGMGMAYGMTTPIANADGEGKPEKAGNFLKHGLFTNTASAILIFFLVYIFSFFINHLGQEPEVARGSYSYLLIISSSIFPLLLFLTFKQFAEGLSDTRFAMIASILCNLLNVFLNYLLIYGNWGMPEMGIDGAGIATLISRILMAAMMFIYIFRTKKFKNYLTGIKTKPWKKEHFKTLLRIGVPSGFQMIFEVSAFAITAVLVGQISAEALAAHQIAISLAALSYMMATGLGAAATVRVGNQLGSGDYKNMLLAGRTCTWLTLIFMAGTGIIFFVGRFYFPTFYTNESEVIAIASQLLIVAVLFQLSDGAQAVSLGALRGMAEVKIPTVIAFVAYWGCGLLPAYLLGFTFNLGPLGIWYGLALGLTAAAIALYWRFEWRSKQLMKGNGKP